MEPSYKDALCKAFCGDISLREVPVGLAVSTIFKREDGDAVSFYVVYDSDDPGQARLEDDGFTVPYLDASGVDLGDGTRAEAFAALMDEYGVELDEAESVLRTPLMPIERLAADSMRFVAFLLRMQDFLLVTRERVEETFRADVVRAVTDKFAGRAEILVDELIAPTLKDYPADLVIRAVGRDPLALFIATSENKALEALLLSMQVQFVAPTPCRVMMVLETAKPARIKERTYARAINNFPVAVFRGHEQPALVAIERQIFGASPVTH